MEMRLPGWVRSIVAISALMQLGFGIALLLHPDRINELWPWTLPPLTARLLGASTLVSIPLAFLSIGINRYRHGDDPVRDDAHLSRASARCWRHSHRPLRR